MNEDNPSTFTPKTDSYRPINCDQVVWMLNAIKRVITPQQHPRVSRHDEMKAYACLYEVMEVANLKFQDDSARWNGTPNDARKNE